MIIDISCYTDKLCKWIRRLQHFVVVVDNGGFTAAAKATFVSQPALSLAVKDLEADLGTPLFDRIGRRVQLTAAGAALLGPARQVLRDLETGRAAVTAVSGLESGVLSLACLPTLAADPMATLIGRFRSHYPGVRVDLAAPEDSRELFELVETGTSELGSLMPWASPARSSPPDSGHRCSCPNTVAAVGGTSTSDGATSQTVGTGHRTMGLPLPPPPRTGDSWHFGNERGAAALSFPRSQ
jgi:hypothetical protein